MRKYVLITGASGGIGKAIARQLASEGYNLYLHYNSNRKSVLELIDELNKYSGEYIPIKGDLNNYEDYGVIAKNIFSLDAIVHNGGHHHHGLLTELDFHTTEKLLKVHITAPLMLTKLLIPKLLQKKSGNIVVISSIWGQVGGSCEVAYSSVKGAQIAFVKALSKEVALSGVRVNAIAPGAIDTNMLNQLSLEELDLLKDEIPMGRLGLPEEIADGVSFLLSDRSSYMTGQVLAINGGWYT